MSSPSLPSDHQGPLSPENAPQVVVRAGKTWVCSACGVLVEIPADVVGQMVLVADPSPQAPHAGQEPGCEVPGGEQTAPKASPQGQPVVVANAATVSREPKRRPPRPRVPKPDGFASETIDGLTVPTGSQLERALAWVSFHLKVLDRQGSELKRLRNLLKKCPNDLGPCPTPRGHVNEVAIPQSHASSGQHPTSLTHQDMSMAPATKSAKGREPP